MIGECPDPDPDCKYYPDCFSDSHHIYPKEAFSVGIAKRFSRLGENIIQICRMQHEEIHATGSVPPPPSIEYMKERLAANGKL